MNLKFKVIVFYRTGESEVIAQAVGEKRLEGLFAKYEGLDTVKHIKVEVVD